MKRLISLVITGAACLLAGCERPPVDVVQHGYRGTGMQQVYNPRTLQTQADLNVAPPAIPLPPAEGPKAEQVYQNVQVLKDLSAAQFATFMVSMTNWVAPKEGCSYCHNLNNLADDSLYTKRVARRMIDMTRFINGNWETHVAQTGVTCYTCHRGQNIPSQFWFTKKDQPYGSNFLGDKSGQNTPDQDVNWSSLPFDPFTPFLLKDLPIRVSATTALPTGNRQSIKQAEWTYGLMTHMSQSLGVNCTYCHNTRSFQDWKGNPTQRVTAWHGIRMVRSLNVDHMTPLTNEFPAHRKGELGDVAKVNCGTCHQGAYKPLYGAPMLKDYPVLQGTPKGDNKVAAR